MKNTLIIFLLLSLLSFKQTISNARFIPQTLAVNDSLCTNNTDLKVYRLYDTRDTTKSLPEKFYPFDGGLHICDDSNITIHYGPLLLIINSKGINAEQKRDSVCTKEIVVKHFGGSRRIKDRKDGGVDITYDLQKKYIKTEIGKIEVSPQQFHCADTGNNPFRIISKGKSIDFTEGGNLDFFESDVDKDGKKELYILNYHSCMGQIEIYKIDWK
ncbi:MAG: hypothetical protein M3R17_18420 [Bacteroidota bacterium]|nr:hypothetical protein [Bacteroidota bacterium]